MLDKYNEAFGKIRSILNSGDKGTPYHLSSYVASLNLEEDLYQEVFLPYIRSHMENIIVYNTLNIVSKCVRSKPNPRQTMLLDFGGIIDPENRCNRNFDLNSMEDGKVFSTMFNNFRYQNPTEIGVSTNNPFLFAQALHQLKYFEYSNIKGIRLGSDDGKRCLLSEADPFMDYINIAQALPSMDSFYMMPNFKNSFGIRRTITSDVFLTSTKAITHILTKKVNSFVLSFSFTLHNTTMQDLKSLLDEYKEEWNFGIENPLWGLKITFHKVGKR